MKNEQDDVNTKCVSRLCSMMVLETLINDFETNSQSQNKSPRITGTMNLRYMHIIKKEFG